MEPRFWKPSFLAIKRLQSCSRLELVESSMPKVVEINETSQFLALKNKWNPVLERSRDDNLFLTWEWLSTYWRHFGKDRKLKILSIEDNNKLIAIAPLRQCRYNILSPVSHEIADPMGTRVVRLSSPIGINIIEPLGYQST
ncbi:MAG: hypothetical protein V1897_18195, partial [Pseudomonadota bacterium]